MALRDVGGQITLRDTEPRDACAERAEIVAEDACGLVVGRAAYARVYGPRAALTLEVGEPTWQHGLPAALLGRLGARAAAGGIATFLIRVPLCDERLIALLVGDFAARIRRDASELDTEFAVPAPRDPAVTRG